MSVLSMGPLIPWKDTTAHENVCELCGTWPAWSKHHLVPKSVDPSPANFKTARLCRACHVFIHQTISNKELAASYNTVELLKAHPAVAEFLKRNRLPEPVKEATR